MDSNEQTRLLQIVNHAKHLDGYGHQPVVSFPRYKSWVGMFFTLVVVGVMTFYICITVDRFINGEAKFAAHSVLVLLSVIIIFIFFNVPFRSA
jgi:hypothetical protein